MAEGCTHTDRQLMGILCQLWAVPRSPRSFEQATPLGSGEDLGFRWKIGGELSGITTWRAQAKSKWQRSFGVTNVL